MLTHFDFHLKLSLSHCVLNVISRCKVDFLILSFPFHIHSILKLAPLSQKSEKMPFAHFLQLYRKNEYGDPHFLFHDFNKDSASFR